MKSSFSSLFAGGEAIGYNELRRRIQSSFGIRDVRTAERKISKGLAQGVLKKENGKYMLTHPEPPVIPLLDEGEVRGPLSPRIMSLEELVEQCQIDTRKFRIKRHLINKWEVGAKHPETGKIIIEPLFQVKAWLEPLPEDIQRVETIVSLLKEKVAEAKQWAPYVHRHLPLPQDQRHLVEMALHDVHFGKLSWAPETGEDFDLRIAEERYLDTVSTLVKRAAPYPIDRIIMPIGSDLLNSDTMDYKTTSQRHVVDEDGRWQKSFSVAFDSVRKAVDMCSELAETELIYLPGNHDYFRSWHLCFALATLYANNERVIVNYEPVPRKYIEWESVLLGMTHGDKEKRSALPMLMANEAKEAWARTKFRYFHVGHLHFRQAEELHGVLIEQMPSISGTDLWHKQKGYVGSIKSADAFIYSATAGRVAQYSANH